MTYQTNRLKLPILSFFCVFGVACPLGIRGSILQNKPKLGHRNYEKTKRTQTDRQWRVVPASEPGSTATLPDYQKLHNKAKFQFLGSSVSGLSSLDSRLWTMNSICTNEPIL
jgi:hypothetical protein